MLVINKTIPWAEGLQEQGVYESTVKDVIETTEVNWYKCTISLLL